jgi:hypothetical protein
MNGPTFYLPDEIWKVVFGFLPTETILTTSRISKKWHSLSLGSIRSLATLPVCIVEEGEINLERFIEEEIPIKDEYPLVPCIIRG